MTDAPQSSPAFRRLPACVFLLVLITAAAVSAQERKRLTVESDLFKAPGEQPLGRVLAGTEVAVTRTQGDQSEIALEGWIFARSLTGTSREGYDLIVTRRPAENLRQAPNGPALARLGSGVLLKKVDAKGGWTQVRRTAWVASKNLGPPSGGDASPPSAIGAGDRAEVLHSVPLLGAAEGSPVGSLNAGTPAKVVGRSGEWTRIAVEGWVRESDLKASESGVLLGVTQAEVRAAPARYIGQVVEWRVQYIALQKADELRPEIPAGQSYLLTRGPLPEPGFVYIIVPPDKLAQFQAVPPLRELVIRGVIKAASTKYLPTPVLDLVSVVEGLGS